MESESLMVPRANAAEEAGELLKDIPKLWAGANLEERRKLHRDGFAGDNTYLYLLDVYCCGGISDSKSELQECFSSC